MVQVAVPWYSRVYEWARGMLINVDGEINRNFGAAPASNVSCERPSNKVLVKQRRRIVVHSDIHGKRACGLVISSGKNRLWLDIASAGSK